jgi:hypothetical protein
MKIAKSCVLAVQSEPSGEELKSWGKLKTLLLLISDWFKQAKLQKGMAIHFGVLWGGASRE